MKNMKMIIAILNADDAPSVIQHLMKEGYSVTRLSTTGGFLRAGNVTILIGVDEQHVQGPHHGKQLVTAKVRGQGQGFQPTVNFIHRPKGVVQGQFGDGALQFLGIGQGMIGLGGKEVENHGGRPLQRGCQAARGWAKV